MKINFGNDFIKLEFDIDENNHIKLTYFGNENNYINVPSNFVELELSETNHTNKNPYKKCNTYYSQNCLYVSHQINKNELVIVTKDNFAEIESHFVLFDKIAGLSTFNVVKNVSNNPINLEFISTFYLYGLGQDLNPTFKDMNVIYSNNGWNSECQWKKQSFIEASLFNTNNKINMNSFVLSNTGSWSTKHYLPIVGIENENKKQFILSQIENNGSWNINIGDIVNRYYVSLAGPSYIDNGFVKCLKPNELFVSCKASTVIGTDFESSVQEITKLRRMITKDSIDRKEMPVIFNDFMHGTWDLSTEELIKPMVDAAAEAGVDVFVMDAGWFAEKTGWPDYIGEWKEYSHNFPSGGLKGMFDYIRSKKMKVGLWFEIENVGEKCSILKEFDYDCFFHINGVKSKHAQRYALNFSKRKVFNWAFTVLSNAIEKYGLNYIKLDYNVDVGIGNELDSCSPGDGLLKNNRALIRLINAIEDKYPNLTIENCASGGQRMDYEMLKVCPIQSSSDLEDYRYYPFIAANILAACPPEVGAIWSYPVCNDTVKMDIDNEVVVSNMVNAMLGRLHLSSKLFKLNNEQFELVKEGIRVHKSLNDFKKEALPIFPQGTAKFFSDSVVAGLIKDKKIILNVWNTLDKENTIVVDLNKYKVFNINVIYPSKLKTDFDFKNNELIVKFDKGNCGRTFEILLK